jgi:Sec-independent protein translocase protein TatA
MTNPIGWIAAIIMAVVAAITLLIIGIKKLNETLNADAIAAENASNTAKELASAYDEAKSSYEEMIAAMEEY